MSLARRVYLERRRVALPVLGFLIANIAVFLLAVLPLRRAVVSAEEDRRLATDSLNEAKGAERRALDSGAKTKQADDELQKLATASLGEDIADELVSAAKAERERIEKIRKEQQEKLRAKD